MVTLLYGLYGCLAWLAFSVACTVLVLVIDRWDRLVARRAKRKASKRFDPMRLDERIADLPDPVVPAPAEDELPPVDPTVLSKVLFDIYRHQTRARFKEIYGDDT